MKRKSFLSAIRAFFDPLLRRPRRVSRPRGVRLACEALEDRCLPAFSVIGSAVYGMGAMSLVADLNQSINAATVQAADLVVDGTQTATSVNVIDADTIQFVLAALGAGTHTVSIASGAILDTQGTGVDQFGTSFAVASAPQLAMKHNPRLQPGDAPLTGYAGSELDRVDILWQTVPTGTGSQDAFSVEFRALGATAWQTATLNAGINTGVEGRVIRSASITGLNWSTNYEYRVRHLRADVIVGEYQSTFTTRLQPGDQSPFTFAAYGDSANGAAAGFRQVQARINADDPAFAVLLGDNVYTVGSHPELDSRFDPMVNPEAAAWMAGHIDYLGFGNHDIGVGAGLPSEQSFSVPIPVAGVTAPVAPPASERPEHNFSWDYGNVHFVTFDTNSLSDPARLNGLLNWAVADLNASSARWKIVYGHHPVGGVPDKPEGAADNYYQQVVNRLKAAGVDLFMVGHSHTYSWTYPLTGQINGTATFVDHGVDNYFHAGEGLPQLVSGVGGVEVRSGNYQIPAVAEGFTSTTPIPARFGYAEISVTPDQLTVNYIAADDGTVIDSFVIAKDVNPQTATFQQAANGYTGAVDTFLHQNAPTTNNAAATSLKVDGDDPAGTGMDAQALLRFDNLFGSGAGQIPLNATLRSATLQLQVTNGSVNNMNLHRMIAAWSATNTWNTLVGGVQTNGVEAVAAPDTSSGQSQVGALSFNVLASLQAWLANPASNRGWAIVPTGSDGVDFHSSEGTVKPKLTVTYLPPIINTPPTITSNGGGTTVSLNVPENTTAVTTVTATDPDTPSQTLSYSIDTTGGADHAKFSIVGATGVLTFNTAPDFETPTDIGGTPGDNIYEVTVRVSDGSGGTDTQLIRVAVTDVPLEQPGALVDGGFESPALGAGAFQYNPSGSAWAFAGGAGLSGNGSAFTVGNPSAPQGGQVAFLQNGGSVSQSFQIAPGAAGNYTVSFQAAQRGNHQPGGNQVVRVLVDGVERGQVTPAGISYSGFTTAAFALGEGVHTLTLQGLGVGDSTAFVDALELALTTTSPGALADGGFESPAMGAGSGAYQYTPSGSAWTFVGRGGLAGNGSDFTVGNPAAPQGGQVAFLQDGGSVSQTFQVAAGAAGSYTVSFQAAQRGNHQPGGNQVVRVLVDGVERGQVTPAGISYSGFTTAAFALGEGVHTLTLQGLGAGDSTAFVDAVDVTRVTQPGALADGGFESPAMGAGSGAYQYTPSGSAWTFAGGAGLSGNGSAFTVGNPSAPQGAQVAFLQDGGSFSQVFQIAAGAAGSYTVSFQAAQRGNHQPGGNQVVRVLVDGVERGQVTPVGISYAGFTTAAFALGEGAHTLTLQGLGVGDSTAFVDALELARIG